MRVRPFISRSIAFLMMLIFSQKVGVGMFLHELLHAPRIADHSSHHEERDKEIRFNCSCVDDLQMPFVGEEVPVIAQAASLYHPIEFYYKEAVPFHSPIFSSLRGPPADRL